MNATRSTTAVAVGSVCGVALLALMVSACGGGGSSAPSRGSGSGGAGSSSGSSPGSSPGSPSRSSSGRAPTQVRVHYQATPQGGADFVCRPGTGCALVFGTTEIPLRGGTYHHEVRNSGGTCSTSAGTGEYLRIDTWDLTPSPQTVQIDGIAVPAHMTGTYVHDVPAVPQCDAPGERLEATFDSGPTRE